MQRFHSIADERIRRRRHRLMRVFCGVDFEDRQAHRKNWRKWISLGGCGNKHCSLCVCLKTQKRLEKRRRRYRERQAAREALVAP